MTELVHHIGSKLPYALSLTKNIHDAKDLLQDLAVKVFRDIGYYDYKTPDEIDKILNRALYNIFIDGIRRAKGIYPDEVTENNMTYVDNDVWGNIQKKELQKELINIKSKKDQLCFRLRIDGYPTSEIKKMLNVTTNTVNQRVMRAKNYLKKQLAA